MLLGCGDELTGEEISWVPIPAGTFSMGCSPGDDLCVVDGQYSELPVHMVSIAPFEMTSTEITQYQYWKVKGDMPAYHPRCGNCPVEYMPHHFADAEAFCAAIGGRLPSEAEWEYAARAGTTTRFYCGDDTACLDDIAWHRGNSHDELNILHPHPVGQKAPNAFGLYDMSGNLQEWVADCSHDDYTGAPDDGSAWTTESSCVSHVFKGGSYNDEAVYHRSSNRYWDFEDIRGIADGFRCARDLP